MLIRIVTIVILWISEVQRGGSHNGKKNSFWLISGFSAFRIVLSKKWISVKGVGPYDPLQTPPPLGWAKSTSLWGGFIEAFPNFKYILKYYFDSI